MQTKKKVKTNQKIAPVVDEQEPEQPAEDIPAPKVSVELVANDETKTQQDKNKEYELDAFGFEVRKSKNWVNKQRVLVLCSRGISAAGRHIMLDLCNLLPHAKKESKLEKDEVSEQINELCGLNSCNNILFFESRKKRDMYLWMGKAPAGPSIKFHVENIHTSDELKMTGNCIKGSRPLLSFDASFEESPHAQIMKEMLTQIFGTPNAHPKSKPFYDHVFSFSLADQRVWFRNYQIIYNKEEKDTNDIELVEIGPRFVICPIKIFEGCMNGMVLYENPDFISPTQSRSLSKKQKQLEWAQKFGMKKKRKEERKNRVLPGNELDEIFGDEDLLADDDEGNGGYQDNDDDYEDYEDGDE